MARGGLKRGKHLLRLRFSQFAATVAPSSHLLPALINGLGSNFRSG
jgi:hypothetical protein